MSFTFWAILQNIIEHEKILTEAMATEKHSKDDNVKDNMPSM